ncbi:MAG: PilC/PilY family type IV pilus protein [Pseudomonadota bacterium]
MKPWIHQQFGHRWLAGLSMWLLSAAAAALPPTYDSSLDNVDFDEDDSLVVDLFPAFDDPDGDNNLMDFSSAAPSPGGVLTSAHSGARGRTLTLTGLADANGVVSLLVTATDQGGESTNFTMTITVNALNDAPQLDVALGTLDVDEDDGSLSDIDLENHFSDIEGDALTFSILSNLPAGVIDASIDDEDLELSTIANANGTVSIVVEARDSSGATEQDTLTVNVAAINDDPQLDVALGTLDVDEDEASIASIDLTTHFSDLDGDALTFSILSNSPSGVIGASVSGDDLDFTAIANANGSASILIEARDPSGATEQDTLTVNVAAINDAPVEVSPLGTLNVNEDQSSISPINLLPVFSDPDGDALTFSVSSNLPAGVIAAAVVGNNLELTAIADANGSADVVVEARDPSGATDTSTLTVNVAALNDGPQLDVALGTLDVDEDEASIASIDLTTHFSDLDGDALTFSILSNNPVGVIGAAISGDDLDLTAIANANGSASILIEARDPSGATEQDTLTVNVAAINDAPVEVSPLGTLNINEDQSSISPINLLPVFSDVDGDALTFSVSSNLPAGVIVAAVVGNNLELTAIADANGSADVVVEARDPSGATDTSTLTVNVAALNDAPTLDVALGTLNVNEDQAGIGSIDLTTHFSDIDGDALTFSILSNNPGGVIGAAISGDDLDLTAIADANGTASILIEARDPSGATEQDTLTINVAAINDAPTEVSPLGTLNINEDESSITPINLLPVFTDVDGDALVFSVTSNLPAGVIAAAVVGNNLELTAIANANGSADVVVEARDPSGATDTSTLTVNVAPVNDPPAVTTALGTLDVDEDEPTIASIDLTTHFDDIDGDALTFSIVSNNPGGVINATVSGDDLDLTAIADANGTASILIEARDPSGSTAQDTLTVNVGPVDDAPREVSPLGSLTVNEDQLSIPPFDLLTVFTEVEGEALTFAVLSNVPAGIIDAQVLGANLELDTLLNQNGTATILVEASDPGGQTATSTLTVDVLPVNDPPDVVLPPSTITANEDDGFVGMGNLSTVFSDLDGDVLTYSIQSIAPAGIVTATLFGSNLAVFTVANGFGTAVVTLRATDPGGLFVEQTLTVDIAPINDQPTLDVPFGDVTYNEDFSGAPSVDLDTYFSDIEDATLTYTVQANVPAGLVNATISGSTFELTSIADANGTGSITVRATDSEGLFAEGTLGVEILAINDAPRVDVPMGTVLTDEDTPAQRILMNNVFMDPEGDPLSYVITDVTPASGIASPFLLAGIELILQTDADANGTVTVTVEAEDPQGETVTDTVTLIVAPVNDPPVAISPTNSVAHPEDLLGLQTVDGSPWFDDPDFANGDTLTFSLGTTGGDAVLSDIGVSGAGVISYRIVPAMAGTGTISIVATDTAGEAIDALLSVVVTGVNDVPVLVSAPPPASIAEDLGPLVIDFTGVFFDEDVALQGDLLTLTVDGGPTTPLGEATFAGETFTLALTPDFNGSATLAITATDLFGETASTTIDITVTPEPDAPFVANPMGTQTVFEDGADFVFDLTAVFDDVDITREGDSLSYAIVGGLPSPLFTASVTTSPSSPTGGTLTVNLTPDAIGTGPIEIEATDTTGRTVRDTLSLEIQEVVAIAVNDTATMNEGDGTTDFVDIDVLANDIEGDPVTEVVATGRSWTIAGVEYTDASSSDPTTQIDGTGTEITLPNANVQILPSGLIRYTPKNNYSGADFFEYTIRDGDGDESIGRVDVTVVSVNEAPEVSTSPSYNITQAEFLDVVAEGGLTAFGFDPDGDPLIVLQLTTPDPLVTDAFSFSPDGSFSWTPDPSFVGTVSFDIQFSDGSLVSPTVSVTIDVGATPPPPPAPPAGEVEFDMNLADVPLEDAVSTEANVLLMMDDSGSMDWDMMTNQSSGLFLMINNARQAGTRWSGRYYYYIFSLSTNIYTWVPILPAQESLDADPDFVGNDYGVWRARSAQYSSTYYNPAIEYLPWRGLDRGNQDFDDVDPSAAVLDPYDVTVQSIDLTAQQTYVSASVPIMTSADDDIRLNVGSKNVTNTVWLPHYYTTTATGIPAWNSPRTRIDIVDPANTTDASPPAGLAVYAGGANRSDCAVDDGDPMTCSPAVELQNFANWFSYYRTREHAAKAALGRAVADTSNLRMGYAVLNDANDREAIASLNSSYRTGEKAELIDQIYTTQSGGGTPLRQALDRAGRHFECLSGDAFGSTADSSPGDTACPILPAPEGQCQNNFTLLLSDGTWNGGLTGDAGNNNDFDATPDTAFDGGVFADAVSGTLADVAMYYYERDLHPSLSDGVPTSARDTNLAPEGSFSLEDEVMHQHMKTYTVGFGLNGGTALTDLPNNGTDPDTGEPNIDFTQSFAWPNAFNGGTAKVDDMLHAAVNGRGEFLQANNPVGLAQAFQAAFDEFSDGSVSVSAVAFGSTRLREGTVEYRGFFNLKFNSGDLVAIELLDPTTGLPPADPLQWSAADQIAGRSPDSRLIVTFDRVGQIGIPFRHADLNADQQAMLSSIEVDYLRGDQTLEEPLGPFRERASILGDIVNSGPKAVGAPEAFRRDRAPFPTDVLYSDYKEAQASRRRVVYVGSNDGMLHAFDGGFADVNVIDNGTGNEMFAFVPNKLIDSTQRFNNDLDQLTSLVYSHKYFVDLTPTVEDVFISPGGIGAMEWRSILIGGLRGGGKGYFALDVTNPDTLGLSEANAAQAVMWEFTDEDDTYPVEADGTPLGGAVGAITDAAGQPVKDLGYTYSEARVVMTNAQEGSSPARQKWAAVFGNGYNSTAGIAKLFVNFINDGYNGWQTGDFVKLNTEAGVISSTSGDSLAGIPNGLGQPTVIDQDLNGTADLVYAGDLQGHLWRFDISDTDPANWTVTKIFTATFDGTTATRQSITTAPVVTKLPDQVGFVVAFGTGSFITEADGLSTDIQSVYGIWDRFETSPVMADPASKLTRLVEQTITNVVDETLPTPFLRIMSENAVAYTPASGGSGGNYGWFIDLDPPRAATTQQGNPNPDTGGLAPPNAQYPGERAIRRIIPRANALVLTTVIPRDADSCFRAPPGAIWFVDSLSGGDPGRPVIDLDNDGVIDDGDLVTVDGEEYAAGILFDSGAGDGSLVDPSVLLGDDLTDWLVLNSSHGEDPTIVRIIKNQVPKTGRLSWWELLGE